MTSLEKYIDYFRNLAICNTKIGHDPATEAGEDNQSARKFAKWNADEVISGLRTQVGYPLLLIQLYETDLSAQSEYSINLFPSAAFTVLCSASANDYRQEEAAYILAEEIMYELLQQIWQDHYSAENRNCKSPFKEFFFDKIRIIPTGMLFNGAFGWHCDFSFEFSNPSKVPTAPVSGSFKNFKILGSKKGWLMHNGGFLGKELINE